MALRFLDFPQELRDMIYRMVIGEPRSLVLQSLHPAIPRQRKHLVVYSMHSCRDHKNSCNLDNESLLRMLDLSIIRLNKQVCSEVLSMLYSNFKLGYSCTCLIAELHVNHIALSQPLVFSYARNIRVIMRGQQQVEVAAFLAKIPSLEHLQIDLVKNASDMSLSEDDAIKKNLLPNRYTKKVKLIDTQLIGALAKIRDLSTLELVQLRPSKTTQKELDLAKTYLQMQIMKPNAAAN